MRVVVLHVSEQLHMTHTEQEPRNERRHTATHLEEHEVSERVTHEQHRGPSLDTYTDEYA